MKQRRKLQFLAYPVLTLCMAACAFTPDLPQSTRVQAPLAEDLEWPTLLPASELPPVPKEADTRALELDTETQALLERAEALRAKAKALDATGTMSADDRQRLANARTAAQ